MLQWEQSAILSTFIKLPFVFETFVLSILEWSFETGFTVNHYKKRTILFQENDHSYYSFVKCHGQKIWEPQHDTVITRCVIKELQCSFLFTVKPVLSSHSKEDQKLVLKTNYRLMQVKSIAECSKGEHSAMLSTFIKLPFVFETFYLFCLF